MRFSEECPPNSVYARNENIAAAIAPDGRVWVYHEDPRLVFNTLLDSGAAMPSLYQHDLECLGVVSFSEFDLLVLNKARSFYSSNRRRLTDGVLPSQRNMLTPRPSTAPGQLSRADSPHLPDRKWQGRFAHVRYEGRGCGPAKQSDGG